MAKAAKASVATNYPERVRREREQSIIREALEIISRQWAQPQKGRVFTSPPYTKSFANMVLAGEEREHFWVAFLNTRHQLIDHKILFSGTIDGASIHPREVVKEALRLNAAAVVVAHNHPSGNPDPSHDDKAITNRLSEALRLVDVRLLDHIIVGRECTSLAELGLI